MALSRFFSVAFLGLDALLVEVEVDATQSEKPASSRLASSMQVIGAASNFLAQLPTHTCNAAC